MEYLSKKIRLATNLLILILLITAGCSDDEYSPVLFEVPKFGGFSTNTNILFGESITFTDTSTRVFSRQWSFPGGNPASSSDSVVTVIYPSGGDYQATLSITHIDNQTNNKQFLVNVQGPTVSTFGFYSEAPNVSFGHPLALEANNGFNISPVETEKFEGERSIEFAFIGQDTWGVQGSLRPLDIDKLDISEFENGTYKVAMKTTCELPMLLRLHTNNGTEQRAILELDPAENTYGLKRDGEWHQLEIPIQDFINANDQIDLTAVTHLLVLRSGTPDVKSNEDWDWYVDNFYLELQVAPDSED